MEATEEGGERKHTPNQLELAGPPWRAKKVLNLSTRSASLRSPSPYFCFCIWTPVPPPVHRRSASSSSAPATGAAHAIARRSARRSAVPPGCSHELRQASRGPAAPLPRSSAAQIAAAKPPPSSPDLGHCSPVFFLTIS